MSFVLVVVAVVVVVVGFISRRRNCWGKIAVFFNIFKEERRERDLAGD